MIFIDATSVVVATFFFFFSVSRKIRNVPDLIFVTFPTTAEQKDPWKPKKQVLKQNDL